MNKILVEVSVGELLDKISILEIKSEKIKDPEKLNFINDEYKILKDGTAITIKIKQGIRVQRTSIATLWVVLEGLGFLDSLNLKQA